MISWTTCVSCGFFSFKETVTVCFPDLPEHVAVDTIVVSTYSPDGGDNVTVEIDAATASVDLVLPKLAVVPVVAEYRWNGLRHCIRPGGSVYPWYLGDDGVLEVRWDLGFITAVLLSVGPDRSQAVNVEKLFDKSMEKSDGNPWLLDPRELRGAIERGSLASSSLTLLPTYSGALPLGTGNWITDNPLVGIQYHSVDGCVQIESIVRGIHRFFDLETAGYVTVSAVDSGWTIVEAATGAVLSGKW